MSFGAGGAVQPQVGTVMPHLGTRLAGMQPTLGHGGAPCTPNVAPPPRGVRGLPYRLRPSWAAEGRLPAAKRENVGTPRAEASQPLPESVQDARARVVCTPKHFL